MDQEDPEFEDLITDLEYMNIFATLTVWRG